MDEDISQNQDAVGHGRIVKQSRIVHSLLFSGLKLAIRGGFVPFARADVDLEDQPFAFIGLKHLASLIDFHSFCRGRRNGFRGFQGINENESEKKEEPFAHSSQEPSERTAIIKGAPHYAAIAIGRWVR